MIHITNRQIGILECFFGIVFLALSIFAIAYTVNSVAPKFTEIMNMQTRTLAFKYNINTTESSSVAMIGSSEQLVNLDTSTLSEDKKRALGSELQSSITYTFTNIMAVLPVFILASICALALSFIMIFQGIYHWNKE